MNETEAPSAQSRRFAKRVLDSIRGAGRHTDADVAAVGGPSDSYMTTLRKAAAGEVILPEPRGHTQKRIEQAAGWMPGSALAVWDGGEPTMAARLPRDIPAGGAGESTTRSPLSDHELMQRLWSLLDKRGAVDMFVADSLQQVERRLAELRVERNLLAHGVALGAPAPEPTRVEVAQGDDEVDLDALAQALLLKIAAQLDSGRVVTPADFAQAARISVSEGQHLRRVQDEAGEENQDPDA